LAPGYVAFDIPPGRPSFWVGERSNFLRQRPLLQVPEQIQGWLYHTRVVTITRNAQPKSDLLLQSMGPIHRLDFDPHRFRWGTKGLFPSYTAKLGRALLTTSSTLSNSIAHKWEGILPPDYQPDWNEVWLAGRPRKEAGFLWSLYHGAVAVNVWRNRINRAIATVCTCCAQAVPETLVHCFFECPRAIHVWTYALTLLYRSQHVDPEQDGSWPAFTFQQCVFGARLPRRLQDARKIWSLLRGTAIWQ
jgi:hypothetical protein